MKTIGFVCEGPRDSDLLEAVVSHILNEDINPLYLQPEPSLDGENGNGWKGVWNWCYKNGKMIDRYIQGVSPEIDLIIIQMDGDVARKEREVHCSCYLGQCAFAGIIFPLKCRQEACPVRIPCDHHKKDVDGYVEHLQNLLHSCFAGEFAPIIIIPCDSTDSWIAAAYEDREDIEIVQDPWTNLISRGKEYHGIRVPGHKKTKAVYDRFISAVCSNWELVTKRCSQAAEFERLISEIR